MIEIQLVNKVLKDNSLKLLTDNSITQEFFIDYPNEITFIFDHYKKYNNVPDKETFFEKFPDFPSIEVMESDGYLVDSIRELELYNRTVPIVNKVVELAQVNANEAIEYLVSQSTKLTTSLAIQGTNIIKDAPLRLQKYNEIKDLGGMARIRTLLPELDDLLFGGFLKGEDLITVMVRTNQGKSWVLELFAAAAWAQDRRVGFYSGEMSPTIVGYRIDTILKHFSNTALMTGSLDVYNEYCSYIENLKNSQIPFIVVGRKELGGKATVSKLNALVEKYELDMLVVDQYSLMSDERRQKGESRKEELGHISDDLMESSIRYKIPVIGAIQASRESTKKKDDSGVAEAPEIEHISESDQVGNNSSRILSIRQVGDGLEFTKKKDRYFGRIGDKVFYRWNIDKGDLLYIPGTGESPDKNKFSQPRTTSKGIQVTSDTDIF